MLKSDGCSSLAFMTAFGFDPKLTQEAQLAIIKNVFGTSWRKALAACKIHDRAYALGGHRIDRLDADFALQVAWNKIANEHTTSSLLPWVQWTYWRERVGIRAWSDTGYAAIRLFGGPGGRMPGVSWAYGNEVFRYT